MTWLINCSRRSQQASANKPTIMSLFLSLKLNVQMLTIFSKGVMISFGKELKIS